MSTTPESRKLLLVEDEPDVMTYLEMLLRDATSFTIADGENAFLAQIGASAL